MLFSELIRNRYSVRRYKPTPVEQEKLNYVLEAMRLAPSALNNQPVRFIVLSTKGKKATIDKIFDQDWVSTAPYIIFACAVPSEGWVRSDGLDYTYIDVAIAMDHLILAATDVGLGTCWIASFNAQAVKEFLNLPNGINPVLATPLGYSDTTPPQKERKPLSDLVKYEC